jgi:hypothetical protein
MKVRVKAAIYAHLPSAPRGSIVDEPCKRVPARRSASDTRRTAGRCALSRGIATTRSRASGSMGSNGFEMSVHGLTRGHVSFISAVRVWERDPS